VISRSRDERGVVLPARLMVLSISAVALAGLVFIATGHGHGEDRANIVAATPTATATPKVVVVKPTHKAPVVRRRDVYVVVFNNSMVHGLAATASAKASAVGWNVVGSDNWYGNIAASTVYYPPRLQAASKLLARDLGIRRIKPAIDPMSGDRLTVILTSDYH
jgi:hypothetical protein